MLIIREARGDDFERVYPLLLEFKNPHLNKERLAATFHRSQRIAERPLRLDACRR